MHTSYEIRDPSLGGIFIGFDNEWDAKAYWDENCKTAPKTHRMHGAVVVRHSWETHQEAETARLDFLLGESGIAKFSRECLAVDHAEGEWLKTARTAIDIARKSPPSTAVVIWPNTPVTNFGAEKLESK